MFWWSRREKAGDEVLTDTVAMASPGATMVESARLFLQSKNLGNDAAALWLVCLTAKIEQLMGPPDDWNYRPGSVAFGKLVVLQLFNQMADQ
jgi:hypothetical protein